ncbi:DUF2271 domain-containing protein [Coralloluteibacterium stylophorae]|uniref:DUF2271 domain-containing protein n=1 Tax=Coralloluteibacterium stylophorae TaxID=1776034 RepID=A0A8J7VS35_9GAMM|nr:DUF2271 domain-containing protein [Coralloluteibacterium stylophorae]MBS7457128.1 DUF2271 domain-containing protein [Coralloluteibacterium stylophorae]
MRTLVTAALCGLLAPAALAAEMEVSVEIPRIDVAEYHRPYVAVWVEDDARKAVANLAVWYDVGMDNREGEKWLKDMRQWWRRSGRTLSLPVDGVTGATRAAGTHTLAFDDADGPLAGLAPGDYTLVVEAAREVGGRELLSVPFQWPPKAAQTLSEQGESELGAVRVRLAP